MSSEKWWKHPHEGDPEHAVAFWWIAQTRKMWADHTQEEIDRYNAIAARHPEQKKKLDWKFIACINHMDGGLNG
jgi:lysozyme family protein